MLFVCLHVSLLCVTTAKPPSEQVTPIEDKPRVEAVQSNPGIIMTPPAPVAASSPRPTVAVTTSVTVIEDLPPSPEPREESSEEEAAEEDREQQEEGSEDVSGNGLQITKPGHFDN